MPIRSGEELMAIIKHTDPILWAEEWYIFWVLAAFASIKDAIKERHCHFSHYLLVKT